MTDVGTPATSHTPSAESPFTDEQIAGFHLQDRSAGRLVGLLLGGFFIFLLILMIGVTLWTYAATTS